MTAHLALRSKLVALAAFASLAGCPPSLDDTSAYVTGSGGLPALADGGAACPDVPSTLALSCGSAGCHAASGAANGLDLASPDPASRLSGKRATSGALLIDPSSPSASVIYAKTGASPPFGARMPMGAAPLSDATRACLLSWITSLGATPPASDAGRLASDAAVADASSNAPSPPSIAGAVVWLDAAQKVTLASSNVAAWGDTSAAKNDASQSDDTHRPTFVASAIAGRPAIRFAESRETFLAAADSTSLHFGTGGLAIALVAANRKQTAGRGHGGGVSTVVAKPQINGTAAEVAMHLNWFISETTDDGTGIHFGVGEGLPGVESTTRGYADGVARVYVARMTPSSGMDLELRVNGKVAGTSHGDAVDVTLAGQPLRIGSTYGQSVEGDVAEVVVVKGALADADVARLESYWLAKYAIAP